MLLGMRPRLLCRIHLPQQELRVLVADQGRCRVTARRELSFVPLAYPGTRPLGQVPEVTATDQLVLETRIALEETGGDPERMAQWIAERIEEFGAITSRGVFTMDGDGPVCSWCHTFWGLCGHDKRTEMYPDDENEGGAS